MKRVVAVVLLALASTPVMGTPAQADGCLVIDEATWKAGRERAMINEPEQKAVVFFSKGKEQLIISPSYEGPTSSFAWVAPVPARPKVEIVKGAVFHELAALSKPSRAVMPRDGLSKAAKTPAIRVLERRTVGAYDVSVLSATDGRALMKWLAINRYHLPSKALGPVRGYVKEGWTFVACRVKAPESAKGLKTGTLAPLKLTFDCKRPIYPLRLSAANPKGFIVHVYLIVPASETGGYKSRARLVGGPDALMKYGMFLRTTLPRNQRDFPTLAKLSRESMYVYQISPIWGDNVTPQQCTRDIVWQTK